MHGRGAACNVAQGDHVRVTVRAFEITSAGVRHPAVSGTASRPLGAMNNSWGLQQLCLYAFRRLWPARHLQQHAQHAPSARQLRTPLALPSFKRCQKCL